MSSEFKRRGKYGIFYANVMYMSVRIRDCLKTVNRNEAQERLIELKLLVRKGDYQKANTLFDDLVSEYKPPTARKEMIVRVQLMPAFGGKKLGELDIGAFLEDISKRYAQSSVSQIIAVMRTLGLEVPACKSKVPSKKFGIDQILEESQVLDVIENHVIYKYRALCLVAAYSMLRLKGLLDMKKGNVDFKRGITLVPSKTKEKNPTPVYIPMSNKLAEAFGRIKVWPMRDDDLWFPGIVSGSVTAFKKAGIPRGDRSNSSGILELVIC